MILVDTSAWVEYLRATGSSTYRALEALVRSEAPLATTDAVTMELLAGERHPNRVASVHRFLARFAHVATEGPSDFEYAAEIYRTCRASGETIRSLIDCLIAAVAVRADAAILHHDRDFDVIAGHVGLALHRG